MPLAVAGIAPNPKFQVYVEPESVLDEVFTNVTACPTQTVTVPLELAGSVIKEAVGVWENKLAWNKNMNAKTQFLKILDNIL